MILGLHSPVAASDSDSSQQREARVRSNDRGEGVFGSLPELGVRRLKVKGVASLRSHEDAMGLTEKQRRKLDVLQRRDQEVRMHEQAHMSAAGGLVRGSPTYTLTEGPDGRMYAIAGHVQLDTGPEPTAEATLEKADKIKAAALAPGDPSPQDLYVASRASMMEMKARGELRMQEMAGGGDEQVSANSGFESDKSESMAQGVGHHVRSSQHMASCPDCVEHAFVGRFKSTPGTLLGVA